MANSSVEVDRIMSQVSKNAVLLSVLNCVVENPQVNTPQHDQNISRSLSIDHERQLANDLAFLAAVTDDPLRVMAVCLEESLDHQGVTIRISSNSGDLADVKAGFESIARALEKASRRENSRLDDQQAVFQHIVALDYRRILTRLRSHHGISKKGNKVKPALILQLNEALQERNIRGSGVLQTRPEHLMSLYNRLERLPNIQPQNDDFQTLLMNISQLAAELVDNDELRRVINTSRTLDPSLKAHLPEALGKIGRYYCISQDLVSAARHKRQIFSSIRVNDVQLDRIPSPPTTSQVPSFRSALQEVLPTMDESRMNRGLKANLGVRLPLVEEQFQGYLAENRRLCRVHAEVQLLFFYESHPELLAPRVISSSKSACYLCNLLFHLHGRFHIPSTHGKLYPKWTLPGLITTVPVARHQQLLHIVDQINRTLKHRIEQSIVNRRPALNYPNESCILDRLQWPPSTISIQQAHMSSISLAPQSLASIQESQTFIQVSQQSLETITQQTTPDTPQQHTNKTSEASFPNPNPAPTPSPPVSAPTLVPHLAPEISDITKQRASEASSSSPSAAPTPSPPASVSTPVSPLVPELSDIVKQYTSSPHLHDSSGSRHKADVAPRSDNRRAGSYRQLRRGETICEYLGVDGETRIATPSIHATLSHQELHTRDEKCLLDCWVHVRWLQETDEEDSSLQRVSLSTLVAGTDFILPHSGSVTSERSALYVTHKKEVIFLDFTHSEPVGE